MDNCQLSPVNCQLIPAGYKRTEVGVIPEDWEVGILGSYVIINSGESPSKYSFESNGIPYFKVEQLNNDFKYLKQTPYYIKSCETVPQGSLIFPKRGASIMLNKIRILAQDSFMDTNLMTLTPTEGLDNEYMYYALTYIQLWKIADTTSIPQINNKHINPIPISLPSIPEQRAIAEVLSDVDALIAALDRLIAKKRAIKQGAMQQLLTGRTRLPGFTDEWTVERLGSIFEVTAGGDFDTLRSSNTQDKTHQYPVYSNAISNNGLHGFCSYNDHRAGSITVTARGTLGVANYRNHDFTAIGRVLVLKPKVCADGFFFSQFINDRIEFAVESTGVPQLTAPQICKYELLVPPVAEQRAIATVLSDMDAEIAALEARRDKTRALKKGMMQELLTGRTRLIDS